MAGTAAEPKRKPPKRSGTRARRAAAPAAAPPPFIYRPHQLEAKQALAAGIRRLLLPWHRRAGKDAFGLATASEQMQIRAGNYWHLYPLQAHARRAVWEGIDPGTGLRYIDWHFPKEHREYVNNSDMLIRMKADSPWKGSAWQLLGSDYYDRLVGSGTVGIVVSEWSLCDPRFWEYARPIIRENGGWVMFLYTFRGRNHAWQMYRQLLDNPEWFVSLKTVRDTVREDGKTPIISEADVAKDRDEGMTESLIQQEYYCNPAASLPGSLYGKSVQRLQEQRSGAFTHDSRTPVYCSWSLEFAPLNISVAFFQPNGNEWRGIGSRSFMFTELDEALASVRSEFPWKVAEHIVPHETDGIYQALLEEHGVYANEAPARALQPTSLITQTFLSRLHVDTAPRKFETMTPESNNMLLLDSLNGYRLKQQAGQEFSLTVFQSFERYLARAVENFASYEHSQGVGQDWGPAPDYTLHDRAVIAGQIERGRSVYRNRAQINS